jgi:heparan-alpha-glucosaminide N-acetyltransferase
MADHVKATGISGRVLSIDIFRGATIVAMVFANTTTKMGLPWWMEHAGHTDGRSELITWVDLIFPAFLFIMGLAIPLAVDRRLALSVSWRALVSHVALRGLLLMWLGGVMYGFGINAEAMDVPIATWVALGFAALVLLLTDVPMRLSRAVARPALAWVFRTVPLGYFVWATTAYRGGDGNPFFHADGFTFSILGLLGFAYIASTLLYLATRESPLARLAICALIVLLGVHMQHEDAFLPAWNLQPLAWFGVLSHLIRGGLIVLAGTFLGELFVARGSTSPSHPGRFMALFGIGFLAAAALVDGDLFATFVGLRKTLFCIGVSALIFRLLWEVEQHKGANGVFRALSRPLLEVGRNPLFAYSLQFGLGGALALVVGDVSMVSAIEGYTIFGAQGWSGAAFTALPFTVAVVALTGLANRYKVRIKL